MGLTSLSSIGSNSSGDAAEVLDAALSESGAGSAHDGGSSSFSCVLAERASIAGEEELSRFGVRVAAVERAARRLEWAGDGSVLSAVDSSRRWLEVAGDRLSSERSSALRRAFGRLGLGFSSGCSTNSPERLAFATFDFLSSASGRAFRSANGEAGVLLAGALAEAARLLPGASSKAVNLWRSEEESALARLSVERSSLAGVRSRLRSAVSCFSHPEAAFRALERAADGSLSPFDAEGSLAAAGPPLRRPPSFLGGMMTTLFGPSESSVLEAVRRFSSELDEGGFGLPALGAAFARERSAKAAANEASATMRRLLSLSPPSLRFASPSVSAVDLVRGLDAFPSELAFRRLESRAETARLLVRLAGTRDAWDERALSALGDVLRIGAESLGESVGRFRRGVKAHLLASERLSPDATARALSALASAVPVTGGRCVPAVPSAFDPALAWKSAFSSSPCFRSKESELVR